MPRMRKNFYHAGAGNGSDSGNSAFAVRIFQAGYVVFKDSKLPNPVIIGAGAMLLVVIIMSAAVHKNIQKRLYCCPAAGNLAIAFPKYQKAAEQGNAMVQNNLGRCYQKSWGVAQNSEAAFLWFKKAAEQGNPDAQNNLGECYLRGEGVQKKAAEGIQ